MTKTTTRTRTRYTLELPTFDIRVHRHERSRNDAGAQWLRDSNMELYSKS